MPEDEARQRFAASGMNAPDMRLLDTDPGVIQLAFSGAKTGKSVVFVHGSPGSWGAFIDYLKMETLRSKARLVSVDRPGFGKSDPRKAVPSLAEQGRRLKVALEQIGITENAILVGHSLGGPVIARMATDYPELVSGLVLVAPSLDPDLEKRKWFNYAAKFPLTKWMLPRDWANSNDEIFPHKRELLALAPRLSTVSASTIVIQGMDDDLVPHGNADYAKRMMTGVEKMEVRKIDGLNHFVPWNRPDLIVSATLELLKDSE